jgi:hypothetical protein
VVGQQHSATQFEVWQNAAAAHEIPLQAKRIEANSEGRVCRLKNQRDGNGGDRVFEASAKESGQVLVREDPAIAEAGIEGAGVAAASSDGMSAARPNLNFVAALLGADLGRGQARGGN